MLTNLIAGMLMLGSVLAFAAFLLALFGVLGDVIRAFFSFPRRNKPPRTEK